MYARRVLSCEGTRGSCCQGLIVSLGLSYCLAGAVVLLCRRNRPWGIQSLLSSLDLRTVTLCIPYLSQARSNHSLQVEGRILS